MKIVHISLTGAYNDGWGYHDNILPYYHKKMGHDVTMITSPYKRNLNSGKLEFDKCGKYIDMKGITIIRLETLFFHKVQKNFMIQPYRRLLYELDSIEPDIIFIHGCQFINYIDVHRYIKSHSDIKLYVDNHADYNNSARNYLSYTILHKFIWRNAAQTLNRHAIKFWGVTQERCSFLREMYHIPEDKIDLLLMGADDELIDFKNQDNIKEKIRNQLGISNNSFVVITGGKIDDSKNIHLLKEALENIDGIYLIVFGELIKTISQEVEMQLKDLFKLPNVRYVGWVEPGQIYNYFLSSDLAIFPGTHSVLWEQAVATGLPIVTKKWDKIKHLNLGGNALEIENPSSTSIYNTLSALYYNPNNYRMMKEVAVERGIKTFSGLEIARHSISEEKFMDWR